MHSCVQIGCPADLSCVQNCSRRFCRYARKDSLLLSLGSRNSPKPRHCEERSRSCEERSRSRTKQDEAIQSDLDNGLPRCARKDSLLLSLGSRNSPKPRHCEERSRSCEERSRSRTKQSNSILIMDCLAALAKTVCYCRSAVGTHPSRVIARNAAEAARNAVEAGRSRTKQSDSILIMDWLTGDVLSPALRAHFVRPKSLPAILSLRSQRQFVIVARQ